MTTVRASMLDVAKLLNPDGSAALVAEVLQQSNPFLQHAPYLPSNAEMGNRVTIRTSRTTAGWTRVNQGYTPTKGTTKQQVDTIGILSSSSEIDARILKTQGKEAFEAQRGADDRSHMQVLSETVASTILYGSQLTDEAAFTGLQLRLETAATSISGSQVKKHHTSPSGSDYTSIYTVDWHADYVHLIYPKKSTVPMGLDTQDKGEERVDDADGNPMRAYVTTYDWMVGLTVKDPRHIARLCNIDVSQALTDSTTLLVNSLIQMLNGMPQKNGAMRAMYMSRNILSAFELQLLSKSNILFSWQEYLGEKVLTFKGIPLYACDAVSEAESLVA